MGAIIQFANLLLTLITFAIIARALLSWFMPLERESWSRMLVDLTEPILAPIRRVISSILPIPIDFSPIVAILLINFLQQLLNRAYS